MEMMNKEQFKKCIEELQLVNKYHTELNNFFTSHDVEGYIYQPDLLTTVLNLLYIMFDDKDEWISYFIFEETASAFS